MEFSCIVFDTAPTGHTLRFLSFPSVLEKALGKLSSLGSRFGPMIQQMSSMLGGGGAGAQEDMFAKLESMREVIAEVNAQFQNAVSGRNRLYYFGCEPGRCSCYPWASFARTIGFDHLHLRGHLRVPVPLRDRA